MMVIRLLLENMPKRAENREAILKENGDWNAKANNIETAYNRYQEYLAEYKNNGEFIKDVTESLDELFFKRVENNETKLANYYDKLIDNYNNEIGQKALLEKAKLLLKQQRFLDVLSLQKALEKVPDTHEIKPQELIYEAALSLALQKLQQDECQDVVNYIETYKLQITEAKYEPQLFQCFMRLARYRDWETDRKSTRLNSSHITRSRMPSSA